MLTWISLSTVGLLYYFVQHRVYCIPGGELYNLSYIFNNNMTLCVHSQNYSQQPNKIVFDMNYMILYIYTEREDNKLF